MKKIFLNILQKSLYYIKKQKNERLYKKLNFSEINNKKIKKIKRVIFVVPSMIKYSGGHTSILRLGTQLSKKYEVEYASYMENDIKKMEEAAYFNLKEYKGKITNLSMMETSEEDILVATFWESVYYIKNLKGYKMYFVQDYEPYFYTYGEKYILAAKTYELGLHMVSLGQWNLGKIEEQLKEKKKKIDFIDFPYEKKEYSSKKRDYFEYKKKQEIRICVYVKDSEKRIPFIIERVLLNLKEELKEEKINLKISYFGNEKYLKLRGGENLGKLSKEELNELYCSSDFGLCASLTNISLVPYEMLATGLPLIEFKEGSFKYFFQAESAILIDFSGKELKDKILENMKKPELLKMKAENVEKILSKLSWEKSGEQFIDIINKLID